MKGKITNSLKAIVNEKTFQCRLLGTESDARKSWVSERNKANRLLKLSHVFLNFRDKTI